MSQELVAPSGAASLHATCCVPRRPQVVSLVCLLTTALLLVAACDHEKAAVEIPVPEISTETATPETAPSSPVESKPVFSPDAIVTFRDDSQIPVVGLELVGEYSYQPSGMYFESQTTENISLPMHMGENWWREIPMAEITSMTLEPVRDRWGHLGWFEARVTTKADEEIDARVPVDPDDSWYLGRRFLIRGRALALGNEGDFEIDWPEVRSIIAKDDQTWTLTDENDETYDVRGLTFARYNSAPNTRRRVQWKRDWQDNLGVRIGKTEVSVPTTDVEKLAFTPRSNEPLSVRVKTRNGEEAPGTLISEYAFVLGKTEDGRIWFGPLREVKEIAFEDVFAKQD